MDYSKMTDFEINKAVGMATGDATVSEPVFNQVIRNINGRQFDPCNSWADAGPIIQLNRIMLNPYCADELWKAEHPVSDDGFMKTYAVSYDKNPLLAAMIVYLMMHDKGEE